MKPIRKPRLRYTVISLLEDLVTVDYVSASSIDEAIQLTIDARGYGHCEPQVVYRGYLKSLWSKQQ